MALTRITKGVIKPNENYDTHNIVSTGIVTAVGLDVNGNADISGNFSVGGVLTYEDVTSIDSVGIITAQKDIHVGAGVSAVGVGTFGGLDINGDLDVDGHTNLDNVSVSGISTFSGILDATNTPASIRVAQDIQHKGDADTKISFDTNRINLDTGGINRVSIADTGFVINDELYINGNQGIPLRIEGSLGSTENIHIRNYTSGGHIQFGFRQNDSDGHHHRAYITVSKGTGSVSGKLELKVRGSGGGTNRGFILDAGVGIQANQRFLPETDSIYDLGSNTLRWQNLFVDDVTVTGVITATKFVGDGSTLTGIDATALKDPAGNVKIQAQASGAVHTGISTFSHTGANQLVIKDSDTSGDAAHMRISFQDSGGTEKFFVGNNNSNGWLYLGSPSGQNNNIAFRVNGSDKFQVNANGAYVNGALTVAGNADIADSIIHTGDTNTKIRFPAADTFTVETAGSERFRIDSSGRVMIGTTTEGNGNADEFTISYINHAGVSGGDQGRCGMTIRSGDNTSGVTQNGYIYFSDGTSGANESKGVVAYEHSNDAMYFSTDQVARLRIDSSGRVLIGTSTEGHENANTLTLSNSGTAGMTIRSTSSNCHIYFSDATSGAGEYVGQLGYNHGSDYMFFHTGGSERFRANSSGITVTGTVDSASDVILKENIKTIDNALDKVTKLRGVEYDYKDNKKHSIGVIAQEVEEVLPELVNGSEQKSVAYGNIAAVLIEAIKEQNEVINKMKKEIEDLKG